MPNSKDTLYKGLPMPVPSASTLSRYHLGDKITSQIVSSLPSAPPGRTYPEILKKPYEQLESQFLTSFLSVPSNRSAFSSLLFENDFESSLPDNHLPPFFLLTYRRAKEKDPACLSLFRSLYQTCYKEEYRSLKKCSSLSPENLYGLLKGASGEIKDCAALRICMMGLLLGIPDNPLSAERPYSCPEATAWLSITDRRKWKSLRTTEAFFEQLLQEHPLLASHFSSSLLEPENRSELTRSLETSIRLQKELNPEKVCTLSESQSEAFLCALVSRFEAILLSSEKQVLSLLEEKEPVPAAAPVSEKQEHQTADLSSSRLKTAENEIRELKRELATAGKDIKELNRSLKKAEEDQKELIALRDYVYHMTEDPEPEETSLSEEDLERLLFGLRIVIIGGHSNWVYKLRNRFKTWIFIDPKNSNTVQDRLLSGADYIFFFTDIIAHCTYTRFIRYVRDRKLSFSYLHGVNISANLRQIYDELQKNKKELFHE